MPTKTKDELLEQSRADALKAFSEKSLALQAQIRDEEAKLKNIQDLFNQQYAFKIEEIKKLENELRTELDKARKNTLDTAQSLKEANIKFEGAKNLEKDLQEKHEAHKALVDGHNSAADEMNKSLSEREAKCVARETEANVKLIEATKRIEIALEQEKKVEQEANNLVHISQNTNEDIVKLQELKKQVRSQIDDLETKKLELAKQQKSIDESRAENEKLRYDLYNATLRLDTRKAEIDKREEDLKGQSIKNELQLKKIQEEKMDIATQSGKLNELKNNVEILMQRKGA